MGLSVPRSRRVWSYLAGAAILTAAGLTAFAQSGTAQRAPARPAAAREADARPLRVLFLGHDQAQPHPSPAMYPLLASPLARRGIQLTHVLTPAEALMPEKLAHYDALMIYGNHTTIDARTGEGAAGRSSRAARAGGDPLRVGHVPRARQPYISLVGGEFQRHGTGEFTAEIVKPNHPDHAGVEAVQHVGRDLRAHEAQHRPTARC